MVNKMIRLTSIDYSHELLQEIKKSHKKNKQLMEKRLNGYEKVRILDRLLAGNVEVKLSSRVSEAEDIYVYNPPLCPDSPYNN
ncbi:hypothetical protein MFLAVUS_003694 [Mucor flavus]|uniref:Uncharacterized protein n=1 Tax=Mucor flavus TaxID=439312 RepID=A0ABP9YTT9_9FUNG